MPNIFSQTTSPPFLKQSVLDYFIAPMFLPDEILSMMTVRTDVKGTERLNMISRPSMLTRAKTTPGFTPVGSFALTYRDITVSPLAMEFEQNARAFYGSVVELLLAQGYKEDDVEQMNSPDLWNKIMLPLIAQTGQADLARQMFFGNTGAEVMTNNRPTGVADPNYTGYNGFWTHIYNDMRAGLFSSTQLISVASNNVPVREERIQTYTAGTDTFINVTINGTTYTQPFQTNATTTVANWLTAHKTNVEARNGFNSVIVTNPTGSQIRVVARHPGGEFTFTATVTGTGSFAASGIVAAVKATLPLVHEAHKVMGTMLDVMSPEMYDFPLVFITTASLWRNLVGSWKLRETQLGDDVRKDGRKIITYEGIPIIFRPDWDRWILQANGGVYPHRAILTTPQNLLFATDGTTDSDMIETWYNQEAQMRRYRVQYKAATTYLHRELMVVAGITDP